MVEQGIFRAMRALLPPNGFDALLRACLSNAAETGEAWREFRRERGSLTELFRNDHGDLRRLGPLLAWNLRRHSVGEVDAALLTVLRTSMLREELRSHLYREILGDVVDILHSQGITFIVIGGADLGASAYEQPFLRHAHDIDLLLAQDDVGPAVAALSTAGFRRVRSEDGVVELRHGRELPVRMNTTLFHLTCHPTSYTSLFATSRMQDVGGVIARVLSREDALAFVLGRASYSPGRATLQWACDAWMIANGGPLRADRLVEILASARLLLPATVLATYLRNIGAPFTDSLVDDLHRAAKSTNALDRDLALYGLRSGSQRGFLDVVRLMPDIRSRLTAVTCVLFPSRAYMQWAHNASNPATLAASYVSRVARVAAKSMF